MGSFVGLFAGQIEPEEAIARGLVQIEGEPGALRRFLKITGVGRYPVGVTGKV